MIISPEFIHWIADFVQNCICNLYSKQVIKVKETWFYKVIGLLLNETKYYLSEEKRFSNSQGLYVPKKA